jgi:hypothetical protein
MVDIVRLLRRLLANAVYIDRSSQVDHLVLGYIAIPSIVVLFSLLVSFSFRV